MSLRWSIAIVMAVAMAGDARADVGTDAAAATADSLRELAVLLGHEDWQVRDQALDKLVRRAAESVPLLEELVVRTTDEEVRTRAEAALAQIEHNRLRGPTYLTLGMVDAAPADVFAELARQAGINIQMDPAQLWPQQPEPITLRLEGVKFWQAFHEACRLAGVRPADTQAGELRLQRDDNATWARAPVSFDGPFLTRLDSVGRQATGGGMELRLQVWLEPRFRPLTVHNNLRFLRAVDDRGNVLGANLGMWAGRSTDRAWWNLMVVLTPAPNGGRRAGVVRGSGLATIYAETDTLVTENPLGVTNQPIAGSDGQFILTHVRPTANDGYSVQIRVTRGYSIFAAGDFHTNRPRLLDAEGRELRAIGSGRGGAGETGQMTFNYRRMPAGEVGEPVRLEWVIPTVTWLAEHRFEFHDVPLR